MIQVKVMKSLIVFGLLFAYNGSIEATKGRGRGGGGGYGMGGGIHKTMNFRIKNAISFK